jgi:hypothetical protein
MKRYLGGNPVPKGVYLNLGNGEFFQARIVGAHLPGTGEDHFISVPGFLPVISAPFFGLGFVILLPLLGILSFFGFVAYKAHLISLETSRKLLRPVLKD